MKSILELPRKKVADAIATSAGIMTIATTTIATANKYDLGGNPTANAKKLIKIE